MCPPVETWGSPFPPSPGVQEVGTREAFLILFCSLVTSFMLWFGSLHRSEEKEARY